MIEALELDKLLSHFPTSKDQNNRMSLVISVICGFFFYVYVMRMYLMKVVYILIYNL